jgi:hypothetical protein
MDSTLKIFVPIYGSYYHFITESGLGLYRLLLERSKLDTLDCQIWYQGNFGGIVQMFSRHPITEIPVVEPYLIDARNIGHEIETLKHVGLGRRLHPLVPFAEYLNNRIPVIKAEKGITIIKRVNRRAYKQTDELALELSSLNLPLRVVQLETISFSEQVNLMRNTSILIAPHGAGTINQMFMPRGGKIFELFPKGYSNWHAAAIAEVFGHKLVDIESNEPGVFGRAPSEGIKEFIDRYGWPNRNTVQASRRKSQELLRIVRDVSSFSIDPKKISFAVRSSMR